MTNREWLNSLSNVDLVYQVFLGPCSICVYADRNCMENSNMSCYEGCLKWLEQEHEEAHQESERECEHETN